ncbi:MAG TPA: SDR family oxidoreductase [Acidimicrobiales bacterium]|nr:SDR family oxidoreductase [Acidimicrobiales bacterium]
MDLGLINRVALVTGASQGLGLATAATLAGEGAQVAITGRSVDKLQQAADQIRQATGAQVLQVAGDITDPDEPARAVGAVVDRFGRLDVLVANAGGPPPARALEVTDQQILDAVNANFLATVRLIRAALPHLEASDQARICAITSSSVVQPIPALALSNLARVGLWGWAKTAAQDLVASGVTLNLACPGLHATDRMTDLGLTGRAGDPGDFGRAVAFLCSSSAAFITGTTLVVDGGFTLGL